jgi:hypothetical protein
LDMRKTVKKIAALVAGTTMVGATIMGAMALDLSNYPAPFVTNGVFNGKIVVGANAATSDVVGAIDIAASLQAAATTTTEINLPGAAGTATVTGDSAEFKTGSDILAIGEELGAVKTTFTSTDLDALKSGVLDTGGGSTPVKQYLRFGDVNAYVDFTENDDDVTGDYLYFPDGDTDYMFEYHLEFTEGADSEVDATDDNLPDLEGEVLTILGAPFTIVDSSVDGAEIMLTMLGGEVADTLRDGETKTYTIGGKDYEVTAVFISSDDQTAKLRVNGVLSDELGEGDTDVLEGEVTIGVQDILTNQREGIVEFYLGANKLKMTDTDFTDSVYEEDATIKVGTESVDNADLIIKATNGTDELTLNYIKYRVIPPTEIWVPAGKGLKEFLVDEEADNALLVNTWDITYAGLMKTGVSNIELKAVSDDAYKLVFKNINGDAYSVPLFSTEGANFKWGDEDDDFIFTEAATVADPTTTGATEAQTFIPEDSYFLVSDDTDMDDNTVVNVLRYESVRSTDNKVVFRDLAGDTMEVAYDEDNGQGELIVGGQSHYFWLNSTDDELAMDLDGSGAANTSLALSSADVVDITIYGGGKIDLGVQNYTTGNLNVLTAGVDMNLNISTQIDNFDEQPIENSSWKLVTVSENAAFDEVTLSVDDLTEWSENDDYDVGMDSYGVYYKLFTPSSGPEELMVEYPLAQRGAQVFVTAGTIEVKEGTTTSSGAIESTVLNPIAVGLAILDTDAPALGSKMIVVGGPCVNTVAAALMGNPATCTEGFTPGKAIIKLFADKNALLVAGYNAQDSQGACYVLADYEDYSLKGTEVEVVVADLNTITVNPVV